MRSGKKSNGRVAGRRSQIFALVAIASSFAVSANAAQILLTVGDSYPTNQSSAVNYDSLSGLGPGNLLATGDTLQVSTPSMPPGLTSASLTISNSQGNRGVASARLAEGVVRGEADGGLGLIGIISRDTYSNTTMSDAVTFHISDGAPSALVGVHVHLDGSEAGAGLGVGGYNAELLFSLGGSFDYVSQIVANGNQGYTFNETSGFPPSGWDSYSISNPSLTGFDFNDVIRVTDADTQSLSLGLHLLCYDNTTCDFNHTTRVALSLPTDVSFTSGPGSS